MAAKTQAQKDAEKQAEQEALAAIEADREEEARLAAEAAELEQAQARAELGAEGARTDPDHPTDAPAQAPGDTESPNAEQPSDSFNGPAAEQVELEILSAPIPNSLRHPFVVVAKEA